MFGDVAIREERRMPIIVQSEWTPLPSIVPGEAVCIPQGYWDHLNAELVAAAVMTFCAQNGQWQPVWLKDLCETIYQNYTALPYKNLFDRISAGVQELVFQQVVEVFLLDDEYFILPVGNFSHMLRTLDPVVWPVH